MSELVWLQGELCVVLAELLWLAVLPSMSNNYQAVEADTGLPTKWHRSSKSVVQWEWRRPQGHICDKNQKLLYKKETRAEATIDMDNGTCIGSYELFENGRCLDFKWCGQLINKTNMHISKREIQFRNGYFMLHMESAISHWLCIPLEINMFSISKIHTCPHTKGPMNITRQLRLVVIIWLAKLPMIRLTAGTLR